MHSCMVKHLDDHIWISFVVQPSLTQTVTQTLQVTLWERRGGRRREGNKGEGGEGEEGEEGEEGGERRERKERREGGRVHQ